MDLSKILERVRKLVALAEHPETPKPEADAARATADSLMEKYAIEEWQTMQSGDQPASKPGRIKVDIGHRDSPFLRETATLVTVVADFCRCSSIWMIGSGWGDREEYSWVYGYESDLRYFELLFTTLYLHMSGAIFPKPDPAKTLGVNAYELHNAGLNWYDIAQAYGWHEVPREDGEAKHMYRNKETGERASWSQTVGRIKAAYAKEVKARGETPLRIPPSGSLNFRFNAAQGYLSRISQRLKEQAGKRGSGTELVLADRTQNVRAAMEEDHPGSKVEGNKNRRFNPEAYRRGTRHANTASLAPEAATATKPALS